MMELVLAKQARRKHEGSNFWDHLKEKGIYEEAQELAEKKYGHLYRKDKTNFFEIIRHGFTKWWTSQPQGKKRSKKQNRRKK